MATQASATGPLHRKPYTLFQRIFYACKLHLMKFFAAGFFHILNLPLIRDKSIQPTFTKAYPAHPTLHHRVFIPKSYKSEDAPLPLYMDIHGGGFSLMAAWADDEFCANFCNNNNFLVISIEYPLAPSHPYPQGVNAVIDTVKAILIDESLPFDRKKVVIGGSSAGAALSLAAAQDSSLQGKIGGVVAYYPPVNFTTPLNIQLASRPKHAPPDPLENSVSMFNWGYFSDDQDMTDPQLSVFYAEREKLPPKLFIIGCEFDLLCKDAEKMAEKWAQVGDGKRSGTDDSWERNGVKWEKILGEEHGFDVTPARGETKIRVVKRREQMYKSAAEWLNREIYV